MANNQRSPQEVLEEKIVLGGRFVVNTAGEVYRLRKGERVPVQISSGGSNRQYAVGDRSSPPNWFSKLAFFSAALCCRFHWGLH